MKVLPPQSEEDDFVEVAAISMAITKTISELALHSSDKGPYLSRILETGLHELEKIDYQNIPRERRMALRKKIMARYTDLITTIPVP